MNIHPHNVEQKTEVMVEHFRQHVQSCIGGRAKAMVVTGSRLAAVRYMLAFRKYIEENAYGDIRPLVAFSGTVRDPVSGDEYTEPQMNFDTVTGRGISEAQLPERFDSDDYQILLVANKYQTGFDQPLLQAMYVDKRLADVQAVQTLSRLNRTHPGKEAPFILDFVNDPDEIYQAFKPYYDTTMLQDIAEPEKLEILKYELDEAQVYHASEVEEFAAIFYMPEARHTASDHARLEKCLRPATDRFKAMDEDGRELFREKLSGYVGLYTFLAQIMPWTDPDLEKLYSFGRFLLPHLPVVGDISIINPEDDVALRYYRLERISSGQIDLDTGELVEVKSPTDVGTGKATDEDAPLSNIIVTLNDRFGTEFDEEDRLFFEQIKEKAVADGQISRTAEANPLDKFELGIRQRIQELMMQRMSQNDEIVTRYMEDEEFQDELFPLLAREIFDSIREERS